MTHPTRRLTRIFFLLTLAVLTASGSLIIALQRQQAMSRFSTDLSGRTPAQKTNIRLAARALNGAVLAPGKVFSFNRAVGQCIPERGFERAPAIVRGERTLEWGGGICQLSSTLYNAALLAGLEIVERRPHSRPASSVPPGRDAAVMYERFDLKIRNTTPYALRLDASITGDRLAVAVLGRPPKDRRIALETRTSPHPLRAVVYRVIHRPGGSARREFISEDVYRGGSETPQQE
ncbi:MAG: VanW family protein [Armatimonadetes bacterium]|nr:VanW family protein [Armatimonadota bacterium]